MRGSVGDVPMKYCQECAFPVCDGCDCSVYHLDYQLAHWEEVGVGVGVEA